MKEQFQENFIKNSNSKIKMLQELLRDKWKRIWEWEIILIQQMIVMEARINLKRCCLLSHHFQVHSLKDRLGKIRQTIIHHLSSFQFQRTFLKLCYTIQAEECQMSWMLILNNTIFLGPEMFWAEIYLEMQLPASTNPELHLVLWIRHSNPKVLLVLCSTDTEWIEIS